MKKNILEIKCDICGSVTGAIEFNDIKGNLSKLIEDKNAEIETHNKIIDSIPNDENPKNKYDISYHQRFIGMLENDLKSHIEEHASIPDWENHPKNNLKNNGIESVRCDNCVNK